jgi:hypothetical protein
MTYRLNILLTAGQRQSFFQAVPSYTINLGLLAKAGGDLTFGVHG